MTIKIPTGIRCRIEPGWFLGILPRSGHGFKYGVRLSNTFGIIDSDYFCLIMKDIFCKVNQ